MSRRNLGVIIARFQAPYLTEAHRYLLTQVATRCGRILVLLGVAPWSLTKRNPLEYSLRARMLVDWWREQYPDRECDLHIAPLLDRPDDGGWTRSVDQLIDAMNINGSATVFCGPDGAGPLYNKAGGHWPVEVLDSMGGHASRIREEMGPQYTEGFRAGIIYAVERQRIGPKLTVDVLLTDAAESTVLLAHKAEDGDKWRFIGGFVDCGDTSLEQAVRREVHEETGLEISTPIYVGSRPVDDWRVRGGPETIMTTLFKAAVVFGTPRTKDDIDDLRWTELGRVAEALHLVHQPLWDLFWGHK